MSITAIGHVTTILRYSHVKNQASICNVIFKCNFLTLKQLFTNLKCKVFMTFNLITVTVKGAERC